MTDIDIIIDCFFVFLAMVITAIAYDFLKDLIHQFKQEKRRNRRFPREQHPSYFSEAGRRMPDDCE